MFLVVNTKSTVDTDAATGEMVKNSTSVANIQDEQAVEVMLRKKEMGDDRLASTRAFKLEFDVHGTPSIGLEVVKASVQPTA